MPFPEFSKPNYVLDGAGRHCGGGGPEPDIPIQPACSNLKCPTAIRNPENRTILPWLERWTPSVESWDLEKWLRVQPVPQQGRGKRSVLVRVLPGAHLSACPLAHWGLAPLGWWPYLRVLHCPKGFPRAVRWGPSSGPLKERRNTVISPGVWLITHLRTEAQVSPVSIVRYYRTGEKCQPGKGHCFR